MKPVRILATYVAIAAAHQLLRGADTPFIPGGAEIPSPSGSNEGFLNLGLQGVGRVSANAMDAFGETFGSVSGLQISGWKLNSDGSYSGKFFTLPDRGFNSGTSYSDYKTRIQELDFTFTPAPSSTSLPSVPEQSQISIRYTGGTLLKVNGQALTTGALPTSAASVPGSTSQTTVGTITDNGGNSKIAIDAEGLALLPNGSGYISDEYGPNIYFFDSAKNLQSVITPPESARPRDTAGDLLFTSATDPKTGRRGNQGMESIAVSPDGTRLFAMLQSATIQDSASGSQNRNWTRVYIYDISQNPSSPTLVAEHLVNLPRLNDTQVDQTLAPNKTAAQSEIVALDNQRFLMLSRDSNGNGTGNSNPAVLKSVFIVDTSGATNILPLDTTASFAVAPSAQPISGVTPITPVQFVNLIETSQLSKFGLNTNSSARDTNTLSEKWEGMALVSALDPSRPNDFFLFTANDNDFLTSQLKMKAANGSVFTSASVPVTDAQNDTMFMAHRITLPEAISSQVASGVAASLPASVSALIRETDGDFSNPELTHSIAGNTLALSSPLVVQSDLEIGSDIAGINVGSYKLELNGALVGTGTLALLGTEGGSATLLDTKTIGGKTDISTITFEVSSPEVLGSAGVNLSNNARLAPQSSGTLSAPIGLYVGGGTIDVGTHQLEITGSIEGPGTLRITGSPDGVVRLVPTQSLHTGGTTINDTTVRIESGSALGVPSIGLNLENATLQAEQNLSIESSIVLVGGMSTLHSGDSTLSVQSEITGQGALRVDGYSGTVSMEGPNTYSGGTSVVGGSLSIHREDALGSGALSLSGGNLSIQSSLIIERDILISSQKSEIHLGENNLELSGKVTGEAGLRVIGSRDGFLKLTSGNTFSGPVEVVETNLRVSNDSALGAPTNNLSLKDAGLQVDIGFDTSRNLEILGSASIQIAEGSADLSGNITGKGHLSLSGGPDVNILLSGVNDLASVSGENLTLRLQDRSGVGQATLSLADATLQADGNLELDQVLNIERTVTIDASQYSVSLTGSISGQSALLLRGNAGSNVILRGDNTFTGDISAETVNLSIPKDASLGDKSNRVFLSDSSLSIEASAHLDRTIDIAGTSSIRALDSAEVIIEGQITGTGHLVLEGDHDTTFSLPHPNAHEGSTLILGTRVNISDASALGSGPLNIQSGTLAATGNLDISKTVSISRSATFDAQEFSILIAGPIHGDGNLELTGGLGSSISLGGTNSFTGSINVEKIELSISSNSALGHPENKVALLDASLTSVSDNSVDRDIFISGHSTIRAISGASIDIQGNISGSGHLSLDGDAESSIRLAPGNTYSGGTAIRGTRVLIEDASALGTGPVQIDSGTIGADGNLDITTHLEIAAGGATIDASSRAVRVTSTISGTGPLLLSGNPTSSVILDSDSTFAGPITIDQTTVAVKSDAAFGNPENPILLKSASLQFLSPITSLRAFEVADQATFELLEGPTHLGGPITGRGSLDLRGSHDASVLLSGTNDLSVIRVQSVTLEAETSGNLGDTQLQLHDATLKASGNLDLGNHLSITYKAIIDAGEHSINLSGEISGAGDLHLCGSPTSSIRISGVNRANGNISITGTELQIESASAFGTASNNISLQDASLALLSSIEIPNPIDIRGVAIVRATSASSVQLTGPIAGDGSLVLTGDAGTAFNLKNAATFSGDTAVVSTRLVLNDADSIGKGPITLRDAELQIVSPLTISSSVTIPDGESHIDISGGTVALSGPLLGSGNLVISGGRSSSLQVHDTSLFSGLLSVNESNLEATSKQSIGSNLRGIHLDGSSLRSATEIVVSSPIVVGAMHASIHADTGSIALESNITGKGRLTLGSSPTESVLVSGNIRIEDETEVTNGNVLISSNTALEGQRLRVNADASIRFTAPNASVGRISGTGKIELPTGGKLTVSTQDTESKFDGSVSLNLGSLVKTGPGGLTLSGSISSSGSITIEGGTLTLGGTVLDQGVPFRTLELQSQTTLFINAQTGTVDLSSVLAGVGRVVNVGAATVNIGTFTGPAISLGSGKIISSNNNKPTSTATVSSGETLSVSTDVKGGQIKLEAGSVMQLGGQADPTKPIEINAALDGLGVVDVGSGSTVTLGGDSTGFNGTARIGQGARMELKSRIGSASTLQIADSASAIWFAPPGASVTAPRLEGSGTFTVASGNIRIGDNKSFAGKTELRGEGVQAQIEGTLTGELELGTGSTASVSVQPGGSPIALPSLSGSGTLNLSEGVINLDKSAAAFDGTTKLSEKAKLVASADLPTGNIENKGVIQTAPASGITLAVRSNISGNGTLSVNGPGTVEIEVGTVFTGPTAVQTGTLKVSHPDGLKNSAKLTVGDSPDSSAILDVRGLADGLTIAPTASLGGSGTILGKIVNQGSTSPGNSPGTLSVDSYTAAGNVEIEYQLSSSGSLVSSDRINATTELVIENTSTLRFTPWHPSAISPRFRAPVTFIVATAPKLTFGTDINNITSFSANPFVDVALRIDETDLIADLSRSTTKTYQGEIKRFYNVDKSSRSIAAAFNQAAQSVANPPTLDDAIDRLEQLILEANSSGGSRTNLAAIKQTLAQANPRPIAESGRLALERMFNLKTIAQRGSRPIDASNWNLWSNSTASQLNITKQDGQNGWHADVNATYLGIEKTVGSLDIGIFGGVGQSRAQVAPGASIRSDDWIGGVTARGKIGPVSVSGVAATGISDHRTKRELADTTARADFENQNSGISIRTQYDGLHARGGFLIKPTIGIDLASYRQSAITETGEKAIRLTTKAKSGTAARTSVGFDSVINHKISALPAETKLATAWIHDFSARGRTVSATFADNPDAGGFTTSGSDLSADAFECAVSHSLKISPQITFEIGASVEARTSGMTTRGNIGFQINF